MKKWICLILLTSLIGCGSSNKYKTAKEKKADLYYSYGTSNLIDKKYTDALTNLMKAATYGPEDTRIQNNLGMAYYFKKDTRSAIKHIKRAIEIDPKNFDAYVNLASVYYNAKNYKQSEKYYLKVQESLTYKNQFRVLYNLALIEFQRGNSLKTLSYLKESTKENPDYCPSYFLEGRVFETKRDFKNAYKSYRKSYHGPCYNNPAPHFKAAVMLSKQGEYLKARLKFNEVMERFPTSQYSAMSRTSLNRIHGKVKNRKHSSNKLLKLEEEVKNYQSTDF